MNEPICPVVIALIIVAVWNVFTFALYGVDKIKANAKKWRVSESFLILCAFLMGSVGALLGMSVFRHKTKNAKFKLLIPLAFILNVGIAVLLLSHFGMIDFL